MVPSEESRAAFDGLSDAERARLHDILAKVCGRCGWPILAEAFSQTAQVLRARGAARSMVRAGARGEAICAWDCARDELWQITTRMASDSRPGIRAFGALLERRLCL